MPDFNSRGSLLAIGALSALIWSASDPKLAAEQGSSIPDFSSNDAAWVFGLGDYIAIPGEPSPTRNDPVRRYVSNNEFRASGAQPTFRIADLSNPNIKPWAKEIDRKSTRLNSSHLGISYAVFCLKKKKTKKYY